MAHGWASPPLVDPAPEATPDALARFVADLAALPGAEYVLAVDAAGDRVRGEAGGPPRTDLAVLDWARRVAAVSAERRHALEDLVLTTEHAFHVVRLVPDEPDGGAAWVSVRVDRTRGKPRLGAAGVGRSGSPGLADVAPPAARRGTGHPPPVAAVRPVLLGALRPGTGRAVGGAAALGPTVVPGTAPALRTVGARPARRADDARRAGHAGHVLGAARRPVRPRRAARAPHLDVRPGALGRHDGPVVGPDPGPVTFADAGREADAGDDDAGWEVPGARGAPAAADVCGRPHR